MPLVGQSCGRVLALPVFPRVGVRRRRVRVVSTPRALPVRLGVAPRPARALAVAAVLRLGALVAGPCADQRAVHRKVLIGRQPGRVGQRRHFDEKRLNHLVLEQPVGALGEHRTIPNHVIHGRPHEPAKQQVGADLVHQLALAAYRAKHPQ